MVEKARVYEVNELGRFSTIRSAFSAAYVMLFGMATSPCKCDEIVNAF